MKAFERSLALDPKSKEAKAGLRRAKAARQKGDVYRGVYECFGTHVAGDPGCEVLTHPLKGRPVRVFDLREGGKAHGVTSRHCPRTPNTRTGRPFSGWVRASASTRRA